MENKEAIKVAKQYVKDVFADEGISDIGLEGISRDDSFWEILIGFDRPVASARPIVAQAVDPFGGLRHKPTRRLFKKVMVRDADGVVSEMLPVE